jgi:CHAT domain-containing protein/tetratricopeptide (TPR) repeat protein
MAREDAEEIVRCLRALAGETASDDSVRWLWAAANQELAETLYLLRRSASEEEVEERISCYQSALTVYSPHYCPVEFARAQNNLGNEYRMRQYGVLDENNELAIAAYRAALTVRTRDADPQGWARTQNNLGTAYAELQRDDRAANQRLAITAYRAALEVHDVARYPRDYAVDQINLGLVYMGYQSGIRVHNLDQAMACFLRATVIRTPSADILAYVGAVYRLAEAFQARLELTPARLRGRAAAALGPVVDKLIEREMLLGIPARPSRVAGPTMPLTGPEAVPLQSSAEDETSWLPIRSLFDDYAHDRYRIVPLYDLVELISSARARDDPRTCAELLRAALARHDVVLPSFRADLLVYLGTALNVLPPGDPAGDPEEAIAALQEAASIYGEDAPPATRGAIQAELSTAFAHRTVGDRAENMERAIHYCTAALRAYPAGSEPWAMMSANLGQCYRDRPLGDPRDNFRRAVAAFQDAMSVWTRETRPYEWARMQNSLGFAYSRLHKRGGGQFQEEAILAYQNALAAIGKDKHPYEWAGVEFNLAVELTHRQLGDRSEDIEQAIRGLAAVLSIRTRERYPLDWAQAQHSLAQAYRRRLAGSRASNLEIAVQCLHAALEVFIVDERPADHLWVAGLLGTTEAEQGHWQAAHEAYASASMAGDILLSQVSTGVRGFDYVAADSSWAGVGDAVVLARMGQLDEAVEAVERGRARWLAEALARGSADPARISDPALRHRYIAAHDALTAAQTAVNRLRWRAQGPADSSGSAGLPEQEHGAEALASITAVRAARDRLDEVIAEIRRQEDPADFLDLRLTARQITDNIDHPVIYLLSSPWGDGLALIVQAKHAEQSGSPQVCQISLPALTDEFIGNLVHVHDGSGRTIGGFAPAQNGLAINWLVNQWPGETFAEKAAQLHAACKQEGIDSTLDTAAQALLAAQPRSGLVELMHTSITDLNDEALGRLSVTLGHVFLRAELNRCLPALGQAVMKPLTDWLLGHGITAVTLIPCGDLPIFPLLAVPLDDQGLSHASAGARTSRWTTVSDRLHITMAPSVRSVMARPSRRRPRSGIYTLGDPRPTHQKLPWAEAEALTVAALAGDPARARVHEKATRTWLTESLRVGVMVSVSCHGRFDDNDFLDSGLLLADGETLTLADVLGGQTDLAGLRLLVLSTCQSAIMDVRSVSNEVRSLAAGLLQAGAQAVVASLWPVDDRATYLLMVRFAQEWLPVLDKVSPAEALARAQRWLRTVTYRELADWDPGGKAGHRTDGSAWPQRQSPEPDGQGAETWGVEPLPRPSDSGRTDLIAVRGRGDRYTLAEAEQVVVDLARERASADIDKAPYADPVFWAAFQVHGW